MGAISGMTGILISHPVDTIKTNIQKNGKLVKSEIKGLYRGILSPLIGVGFEKAIVFGMYNKTQNIFVNPDKSIPLVNAISGSVAGLSASLIVTPYERIKILLQNGNILSREQFKLSSLYRGLSMTFTREIPGFAIYFTVFEWLKYNINIKKEIQPSVFHSFIYGGISGATAWVFIYPQDRIKTILQSSMQITSNNKNSSIKTIIQNISAGGIYKGFSWALYRGLLLHSGTFAMMEYLTNYKIKLDAIDTSL
jgi:solute carrier family 25 carnitine/acylcarnitine transporter 20/29